jgi:SAM-dependent methyltransferase
MTSPAESIITDVPRESAHSHLRAIVANRRWLAALDQWYQAGGRPSATARAQFDLNEQSWQKLQFHLRFTGWFASTPGTIAPTMEGQDLLTRANELYRAVLHPDLEDQVVGDLLAKLPRGGAVDIGCGTGYSALRLSRLGFAPLYAYDLSPVAIAIARALLDNEGGTAKLYAAAAKSLSEIENGSLALIFSRSALQYFKQSDLASTVRRTLRPGGYLVAEIIGLRYYLQSKHLRRLFSSRWRQPVSYARTILRTMIYEAFTLQPRFAARAPEIGYSPGSISRLARWAGLEVLSIAPAPSLVGYVVVMRKQPEDAC